MSTKTPSHPPVMSRRSFGIAAALGLSTVGLGLAGCGGGSSSSGGPVEIDFVWWGDANRAKGTQAAIEAFQRKNPGIVVKTDYQDSSPYQDKLATRIAARDAPDLMAMPNRSLREYADRGALADLRELSDVLDLSGVTPNVANLGTIDDGVFGVAAGLNTIGFVVRRSALDRAGLPVPDGNTWSWDDFDAMANAISAATNREIYGTAYSMWTETGPIVFTRQRGEDFYTADGKLGASAATLETWFQRGQDLRASGGYPPPGFIEKVGSSAEQSYIAKGTIASQIIPTNNLTAYQSACDNDLELLRIPGETQGQRRGMSVDCSQLWSISAQSEHPKEAAALLNFLVNDPDAYAEMLTTRGVPPTQAVTDAIRDKLPEYDRAATEFLEALGQEELAPTYVYPKGAATFASLLETTAAEVEFSRQTPAQAAQILVESAASDLSA
jgi:multiple sugar transport system substrate-binding protein